MLGLSRLKKILFNDFYQVLCYGMTVIGKNLQKKNSPVLKSAYELLN